MAGIVDNVLTAFLPGWKALKRKRGFRAALGFKDTLWTRYVSEVETRRMVDALGVENVDALEISGHVWTDRGFRSYRAVDYPEFDVCRDKLPERFGLIIAEHVFEHLLTPGIAARNILEMLIPGGRLLMVTPFLFRVHPCPYDCSRWTETGVRQFLVENGFPAETIQTGSWGNRRCAQKQLWSEYQLYHPLLHSIRNEPEYPIVIWALAMKSSNA
jgi:hypothetical protein